MDTDERRFLWFAFICDLKIIKMDLNIAEIPFDSGNIKFRYSRYLASDKSKWVRHGLFTAFHSNGTLASEGEYEHGFENGIWRDFHENGVLAAEGEYRNGKKFGIWKYWNLEGVLEENEYIEN